MKFNPRVTLFSNEINNKTTVTLVTIFDNGGQQPMAVGDYIELIFQNPYEQSEAVYRSSQRSSTEEFYQAFPVNAAINVTGDNNCQVKDATIPFKGTVRFYIAAVGTSPTCTILISPFLNPYSAVVASFQVLHFHLGVQTQCSSGCLVVLPDKFKQYQKYEAPTTSLLNGVKYQKPTVATQDGSIQFTFKKGKDFPKYGGRLQFVLPTWVDTNELVFTNGSEPTVCTSNDLEKDQESLTQDKYWSFVFRTTLNDRDSITLTCTKYKNPTYPSFSRSFTLSVLDNERTSKEILTYPDFEVDGRGLNPFPLQQGLISMNYQIDSENYVNVPIQTSIELTMSFLMPFPLQDGDCYLKVKFPKDIPLSSMKYYAADFSIFGEKPDGALSKFYFNNLTSVVPTELVSDNDFKRVFNLYQAYNDGNYFILKGCSGKVPQDTQVSFKLSTIQTPQSKKTTEAFTFELFKSFQVDTYQLDQQILSATTNIQDLNLIPGSITNGNFKASISFIQTPAVHEIFFTLGNNLPVKTKDFDSNILVKMPKIMTITRENNDIINGKETDPQIKILDSYMKVTSGGITRHKDPKVGCDVRPCYLIRHQNFQSVPAGSLIRFQITGTTNQLSITKADDFQVTTQIEDLGAKTQNAFYSIDNGTFDSNFTTLIGGISGVSKSPMTSSSQITWDSQNVVYTIYFQLGNYIPKNGAIKVQLPNDLDFVQSPNTGFVSNEFEFLKYNDPEKGSFIAVAKDFIPVGSYSLQFGGIRNPRSLRPTDPFNMSSFDSNFNKIGRGVLDNIRMLEVGTFSDLNITQTDLTNGVFTDYTVTMQSPIPFFDGDIFYLNFPRQIQIPKEPICIIQNCIKQIICSAEKTRIITTFQQLNDNCNIANATISYTIKNVINAPNTIPTDTFAASWTSNLYQQVGRYKGVPVDLTLTNKVPGDLRKSQIINEQSNKDFGVKNEYSFRITPTNPIPSLGVIEIVYPNNVMLDDSDDEFYKKCKAQTTTAYIGNAICKLDRASRTIFIYNVFLELQQSTTLSQFTVSFFLTNPVDNFDENKENLTPEQIKQSQYDRSFHINTYTFNPPKDSPYVLGGYLSSDGKAFVDNIMSSNTIEQLKTNNLLYSIDSYKQNDMVAQLKCNAPCYTCLDSDPNYCSSCWGKEAKANYKNYFLQKNKDGSSCKESCDDGYTTNGVSKNPNTKNMYYECSNCDMMCATCKGQGKIDLSTGVQDFGKDKDRSICLTCDSNFPFLKEEDSSCVVTCGTGYYQKQDQDVCGTCNTAKCQSCQFRPDYCMSCHQDNFVPQDYRDISQIEEYIQNQAALVINIRANSKSKTVILNTNQRSQIQKTYSSKIQISNFMDEAVFNATGGLNTAMGLQQIDGLINVDSETTYREMYRNLTKIYVNPLHSLDRQNNQCLEKCPPGFTDVSGICLPCQSPCKNCRGQVTRCEICLREIPEKYIYGTACYETCPTGTAPDDDAFECKGCDAGCSKCEPKDTKTCLECDDPLYLHKGKCLSVCPINFRPSFFGKTCEPEATLPIIYFPFWILTILMLSISIAGKYSSKNVSGQHRVFLSFYCWIGVLDVLALWVLLIICLIQGQIWHIIFPILGLTANYWINYKYKKLIDELDPTKPEQEDRLTLDEVKLVNQCDINFDKWNTKYLTASKHIRRCTIFVSHKFFQFPFTHFFGYLHCTLRTQDYYSVWEWRDIDVKYYQKGQIKQSQIDDQKTKWKYIGKLVPKNARAFEEIMMRTDEEAQEVKEELENDKLLEGGELLKPEQSLGSKLLLAASRSGDGNTGALAALRTELKKEVEKKIELTYAKKRLVSMFKTLSKLNENNTNPFEYVQHPASYPRKYWQKVPDLRVRDLFKWQMKVDIICIRLPVIIGNIIVIAASMIGNDVNQHLIQELESILFSVVLIFAQIYLSQTWEEQRLPEKMKDNKANYLFRQKKSPNEVNKAFGKYDDDDDMMPEWGKYLPFYKFNEIFLDNKLEELLNIFGRRQCKSCIDFPTGWDKEEDPRRTNSWPLSRVAEENFIKRGDDFNLIDFQLQNNVYADTAEPTIMFESVARDFSEFGVQVFQFDVLNALGRKGGDLLNPSIDQEQQGYKKTQKKKRGRKNKYYKQIDQEDDEEANQISDETENDGLDHVKEEDEEDEEEELIKKRKAEEALLAQERRKREEEERKKKDIEDELKRKAQEEEAKKRAQEEEVKKRAQEEAKKKSKEDEEKKRQKEEEARLLAEEEARKAAEALKLKKEKELRDKEQKDYEDRIARELLEAQRKQAADDEALKQQIVRDHSPTKNLDQDFGKVKVQQDALNLYKDSNKKGTIEAPPNLESRKFNECDIIGDLDRDEKGNVIPLAQAEDQYVDKQGRPTNQRGYLVDKNGNLVNNLDGSKMFPKDQLDERGEVPAPFNLEKFNFNPHHVRGDFDFDRNGKPVVITKKLTGQTASPGQTEITLDKRSSKVTTRGYRIDQQGNMIDNYGRKKFDKSHMTPDGDLPKLFNYNGRRFNINDCIGQLDKDANGEIIPQTDRNGNLVDNLGRRINTKGYLIDEQGNVIDKEGRQIFEKKHLKDDEIPKIFPFTKFNLKNILGDFEMDPLGNPMLSKNKKGQLIDSQGRVVNQKGYLIDEHGNVINKNGKKMFGKELLDAEGDIPKVFRTGLLKSDTASSLSRLMSEIEKNQLSDFDQEERRIQEEIENQLRRPKGNSGNTSVDSMMEDTPANYNAENQRFDTNKRGGLPPNIQNASGSEEDQYGTEEDEMNGGMMGMTGMTNKTGQVVAYDLKKKKKKKKKKKPKPVEYEDPSLRDHLMAGAYGGVAKPKVKRPGVKYTTNIDAGLREIITPGSAFRRDPSNRVGLTINRSQVSDVGSQHGSKVGKRGGVEATSQLLDPQQREAQLKAQQLEEIRKRKIARAKQLKAEGKIGKISKDVDFEKMFGKDIDEFLEDSEWDIESIDKMSQFSKGSKVSIRSASQTNKLKGLEKVYLQRIEPAGPQKAMRNTGMVGQQQKVVKKANFRGDGDNESVNSRNQKNPAGNRKKAWDTQSRTSNVSLVRR